MATNRSGPKDYALWADKLDDLREASRAKLEAHEKAMRLSREAHAMGIPSVDIAAAMGIDRTTLYDRWKPR